MSTTDTTAPRRSTWRIVGAVLGIIIVLFLLIVFIFNPFGWKFDASTTSVTAGKPSSSEPASPPGATPTPTPTAEECPAEFVQHSQFHKDSAKLINGDFEKDVYEASERYGHDGVKNVYLRYAGNDATVLAAYAHHRKLVKEPLVVADLVENGCLSEEGQELYDDLETITMWDETKFAIGLADPNGYNSGVDENGTYGVDQHSGVRGDLDAIVITEADGSKSWVLLRCGNPVYPGKPNLPAVPTDNPPPTTPPGTGGDCVDCGTDDQKLAENDVESPGNAWTPQPVTGQPAAPAPAPAAPLNPAVAPHTDPGPSVPVTGATPAPPPEPAAPPVVIDPTIAPTPDDPGTEIGDPD